MDMIQQYWQLIAHSQVTDFAGNYAALCALFVLVLACMSIWRRVREIWK